MKGIGVTKEVLGKYIQLEDDETAGAKKGYVKDKYIAERMARYSESRYREEGDVEGANRSAEYGIGNLIARDVTKESLSDAVDKYNMRPPSAESAAFHFKKAFEDGDKMRDEYKAFVAKTDSEKLDELRKKMRE